MDRLWSVKIAGIGHYLPREVVTSAEIEQAAGLPAGFGARNSGVWERRRADLEGGETPTWMGAQAALEACRNAGIEPADLDLIINASGTPEQAIPDNAPLIQRHMGLGNSGIQSFSVHATCLSFLIGFETAAERLESGRVNRVLIVSTEVAHPGLSTEPEVATLFGDAAAAVVLTRTPAGEDSAVHSFAFHTYGDGADLTACFGGGMRRHPCSPGVRAEEAQFVMRGPEVLRMAVERAPALMQALGVSEFAEQVDCVIAHQTSKAGLNALSLLGFERSRVERTLDKAGNCVAASIPLTLHHAVRRGALNRGELALLCGTGAGLSLGGMVLTY